jgi:hypothetical protein
MPERGPTTKTPPPRPNAHNDAAVAVPDPFDEPDPNAARRTAAL